MAKKNMIQERIEVSYSPTGRIEDVIKDLTSTLNSYSSRFTDIKIVEEWDEDDTVYSIYGSRLETDEEYKKRREKIKSVRATMKRIKKSNEEKDWKEYERLKKKFGKK